MDSPGSPVRRRLRTIGRLVRSGDLVGLIRRSVRFLARPTPPVSNVGHGDWRQRHVDLDDDGRQRLATWMEAAPGPTIAVQVAFEGERIDLARRTMASVAGQASPRWLLVLGDEDPVDARRSGLFDGTGLDSNDPRVRLAGRDPIDPGAWRWSVRAGDVLHEAAVAAVAGTVARNPGVQMVTVDEDHVAPDGTHLAPHAKPAFAPDLLRGVDHLGRAAAFAPGPVGAGPAGPEARSDHAVHERNIRCLDGLGATQVAHVPLFLFSRSVPDGRAAIPHRRVVDDPPHQPHPRVSVIVPTRDQGRLLERCLASIRERSTWPDVELVVVDHETTQRRARRILDGLSDDPRAVILRQEGPFNFSAMVNRAAGAASGDVLCLLNNDTEVVTPDWLDRMVGQLDRPGVGVVGALLLFSDGTIQHAGIHPGFEGLMGHGHKHRPGDDPGYFGRLTTPHEVAAVTGACLAIRRDLFDDLGGLDAEYLPVAYNDVDLCLRTRAAGLRVLLEPRAVLQHHESISRGFDDDRVGRARLAREAAIMRERWGSMLEEDPAYSPNLSLDGGGFWPADPPRFRPPWDE